MNSVLLGIGAALPKRCITNDDLPVELNTSDSWISQRTGIKQRYIAENNETTASLAIEAATKAVRHANISVDEIDLIIVGTVSGDYTFPSTASIVQGKLELRHCVAFDVNAACSGFVFAVDVADSYIRLGKARCALVIGAETFSKLLDWTDRSTCVLFGDGAGAIILRGEDCNKGIQYCKIHSDGAYADLLMTSGGVSSTGSIGVVRMDGRQVFKYAIEKFDEALDELLKANNMTVRDIDLLVPHQANVRIIEKLIEHSGIAREKVLISIAKYANTSAASIPISLNEARDNIFFKKNIVLLSMGAGFTWGSVLIKM
jgi:3-oxoacyl-[acyl-carrier-protein] synthase-3